jgi:hypothetical protein
MLKRIALLALVLVLGSGRALAATYDESVNGDISGDRTAPSSLTLDGGGVVNLLKGTTIAGDLDYITIHASTGIANLRLTQFDSADDLAFMAIQAGSTFTEPPTGTDITKLLGWAHISLPVPTEMLPILGTASGAIGIPAPYTLPGGDYTLWIQQTGAQTVAYSFEIVAAPEPGVLLLASLALAGLAVTRRRAH